MSVVTRQFLTAEQYSESIQALDVDIIQVSKGVFNSQQSSLMLSKMIIGLRQTESACVIEGSGNKSFFSIAIPCQQTNVNVNGPLCQDSCRLRFS